MTPRAQKIFDQVPKTPEELLKVIKGFMDNPNMDGYEFLEKILGSDRRNWGPVEMSSKGFGDNRDIEYGSVSYSRLKEEPLPVPYTVHQIKIDKQNKFLDIDLSFYENPSFLLTPAVAQKILGPPSSIYVSSPKSEFSIGSYWLLYLYHIEFSKVEAYKLQIYFVKEGESDYPRTDQVCKRRHEYYLHTKQRRKEEKRWRSSFENHKNFLPVSMRFAREF
jgi:hypothetical protein